MVQKTPLTSEEPLFCPQCKQFLELTSEGYLCKACSRTYTVTDGIPQFVIRNTPADSFNARNFEFLYQMEQKHFWHTGRREIILDILKSIPRVEEARILEIGCGNGSVLAFLKKHGLNIEGGDIFLEGLHFCQQRSREIPLYQIDLLALPFINNFNIIGLFDVLEHIENDEKALSEVNSALKPGGQILVTVPAHRFLWSHMDEISAHQRRYSKKELLDKLEVNGFTIHKATYYISLLFPLLFATRLISKIKRKNNNINIKKSLEVQTIPVINQILLLILRLERMLLKHLNLPIGASLLILAEKRVL